MKYYYYDYDYYYTHRLWECKIEREGERIWRGQMRRQRLNWISKGEYIKTAYNLPRKIAWHKTPTNESEILTSSQVSKRRKQRKKDTIFLHHNNKYNDDKDSEKRQMHYGALLFVFILRFHCF